jgi:hypothetical protein
MTVRILQVQTHGPLIPFQPLSAAYMKTSLVIVDTQENTFCLTKSKEMELNIRQLVIIIILPFGCYISGAQAPIPTLPN